MTNGFSGVLPYGLFMLMAWAVSAYAVFKKYSAVPAPTWAKWTIVLSGALLGNLLSIAAGIQAQRAASVPRRFIQFIWAPVGWAVFLVGLGAVRIVGESLVSTKTLDLTFLGALVLYLAFRFWQIRQLIQDAEGQPYIKAAAQHGRRIYFWMAAYVACLLVLVLTFLSMMLGGSVLGTLAIILACGAGGFVALIKLLFSEASATLHIMAVAFSEPD